MGWDYYGDSPVARQDISLPSGATGLSDLVDMAGWMLLRIDMPAAWDAAALTFQVGADADSLNNLKKGGAEYSISVAADDRLAIAPEDSMMLQGALKLRSGTSGTPVSQSAERIITLIAVRL